jgi:hypothetical protein
MRTRIRRSYEYLEYMEYGVRRTSLNSAAQPVREDYAAVVKL